METTEKESFQIPNNNFQNCSSEFSIHTTFKTTAYLTSPHYANISVSRDNEGTKLIGVKTSQSLMQIYYKNQLFERHEKIEVDEQILERQTMNTINYLKEVYEPEDENPLVIGYQSGLVSCISNKTGKIIGLYNCDEKRRNVLKSQSVRLLAVVPHAGDAEILVIFEDSTAMKYRLTAQAQNTLFIEKISKFEAKISFIKALNKFKHKTKTKNNFVYSSCLNDLKPEFNHFHAYNKDPSGQNPVAYYKFNYRTMSDVIIKKHPSFSKTILKDSYKEETSILGLTTLEGYLVLFEFNKMKPILSYKAQFGGINSLTFSESCEMVALSGQDDCITILDLNTLTTLRCEGHKSFVSRAIFQPITIKTHMEMRNGIKEKELDKSQNNSELKVLKGNNDSKESDYIRVVGGGLDACLSFWEFRRDIFGPKMIKIEESRLPLRLSLENIENTPVVRPVHMEPVTDAIGWIELCDDMLIQSSYDGLITAYLAKDLVPKPNEENEKTIEIKGKAKDKEEESRVINGAKKDRRFEEGEEAKNGEVDSPTEDTALQKQESNTDFIGEQEEYTAADETVSNSMLYFEGLGGRSTRKSPSRCFNASKVSESTPTHGQSERG